MMKVTPSSGAQIVCPKLTEMEIMWDFEGVEFDIDFIRLDCPMLTVLHISVYATLSCLPTMLLAVPNLRALKLVDYGLPRDHMDLNELMLRVRSASEK